MLVTAHNRGPDPAPIHLLPTLWFRNTWSWEDDARKPTIAAVATASLRADHHELGEWLLSVDASAPLLFCENETNNQRLFGGTNASPYAKDGINDFVVAGDEDAVNAARTGTKIAAHHVFEVPRRRNRQVRLRLTAAQPRETAPINWAPSSSGDGNSPSRGRRLLRRLSCRRC